MVVKALPLLSVFAAGCLSGGVLIALWHEPDSDSSPSRPDALERTAVPSPTVTATPPRALAQHASPRTQPLHPLANEPVNDDQDAEPIGVRQATRDDGASEPSKEAGTSVADVLIRLEVAYHRARAETHRAADPPAATANAAPREPVTHDIRVDIADATAPPDTATAVAHAEEPARASAEPAVPETAAVPAARNDAPQIHVAGDVHQNHYAGNVHQGDVNHVQQVAILQYLQLLALPPRGALSAPLPQRPTKRRPTPFPTNLTDPNNPWGFDFPPTVLVK